MRANQREGKQNCSSISGNKQANKPRPKGGEQKRKQREKEEEEEREQQQQRQCKIDEHTLLYSLSLISTTNSVTIP